jgi:uncharacterized protein with HEPN domain
MQPESRKLLWDALQAANLIAQFLAGHSFERYADDDLVRSAVERKLEIIGEALAQLRQRDANTAARIPELRRVAAFRNMIVHGYASLDHRVVWGIIEGSLPGLRVTLAQLLDEA